jgi:hypothetical protein
VLFPNPAVQDANVVGVPEIAIGRLRGAAAFFFAGACAASGAAAMAKASVKTVNKRRIGVLLIVCEHAII